MSFRPPFVYRSAQFLFAPLFHHIFNEDSANLPFFSVPPKCATFGPHCFDIKICIFFNLWSILLSFFFASSARFQSHFSSIWRDLCHPSVCRQPLPPPRGLPPSPRRGRVTRWSLFFPARTTQTKRNLRRHHYRLFSLPRQYIASFFATRVAFSAPPSDTAFFLIVSGLPLTDTSLEMYSRFLLLFYFLQPCPCCYIFSRGFWPWLIWTHPIHHPLFYSLD